MIDAFKFKTRHHLIELLGRKAKSLRELLYGIKEVPASCIYYHTHKFLQQHHYLSPEPPNDFAFWIRNALSLDELGERLASVDTIKFHKIHELRDEFIKIIKGYLKTAKNNMHCQEGEEFHFMACRTFIIPTPYAANTLEEFIEILNKISIYSLYFHVFEARLRLERDENDFSNWFEAQGYQTLSEEISKLDPYTMTLEGLRNKIIQMVAKHVHD
jgi:septum formation topological specificity factor MinE